MKGISENLRSLRKAILSSTETDLKPSSDFNSLPLEDPAAGGVQQKQITEDKAFPEVKEETWDAAFDNLFMHDGENMLGNEVKQEDGFEDGPENNRLKENTERMCLMSLDVTEYELQVLEHQAQEKHLSDVTCNSEVLSKEKMVFIEP